MRVESTLSRDVNKAKMSEADKVEAMARIHTTTTLDDVAKVDFLIEVGIISPSIVVTILINRQFQRILKRKKPCLGN